MFGFEKKFTSKKTEETEVVPAEESADEPEDYNVVDVGRRNFLRQSATVAATAGMAAVGMSPESAEAAESKAQIGLENLSLSGHNLNLLKLRLGQTVPDAQSVQVSLKHTAIVVPGFKDKASVLELNIITASGKTLYAKSMTFGTISDQGGITRLLTMALDDLKVTVGNK